MCAGDHRSQVVDEFGIKPPTVSEYLDSKNKKLIIPSPHEEEE